MACCPCSPNIPSHIPLPPPPARPRRSCPPHATATSIPAAPDGGGACDNLGCPPLLPSASPWIVYEPAHSLTGRLCHRPLLATGPTARRLARHIGDETGLLAPPFPLSIAALTSPRAMRRTLLITAGYDHSLRQWDGATGTLLRKTATETHVIRLALAPPPPASLPSTPSPPLTSASHPTGDDDDGDAYAAGGGDGAGSGVRPFHPATGRPPPQQPPLPPTPPHRRRRPRRQRSCCWRWAALVVSRCTTWRLQRPRRWGSSTATVAT